MTHTILQKLHVTENLISRLGLEKELIGHSGCVNCLEWNESGQYVSMLYWIYSSFIGNDLINDCTISYFHRVLASASDDKDIILWDPFRYEKKLILHSGHRGNIFSVKVS